jgi:hypothetical protein
VVLPTVLSLPILSNKFTYDLTLLAESIILPFSDNAWYVVGSVIRGREVVGEPSHFAITQPQQQQLVKPFDFDRIPILILSLSLNNSGLHAVVGVARMALRAAHQQPCALG